MIKEREEFILRLIIVLCLIMIGFSLAIRADERTGVNIYVPGIGTICPTCTKSDVNETITGIWLFKRYADFGESAYGGLRTNVARIYMQEPSVSGVEYGYIYLDDLTAQRTWMFPDASGTVAVSATAPITLSAAGAIGCASCLTSAPTLQTVTDAGATTTNAVTVATINTGHGAAEVLATYNTDVPPGSPNAIDDEFNDGSFSGWTTHGGATCVPDESTYPGFIYFTGDCFPEEDGFLTKAVSLSGDFNFVIKAVTQGGDGNGNARARVCVLDASGNGYCAGIRSYATLGYRCSYGTVSAYAVTETNLAQYGYEIKYMSIRRDSGIIYYCYSNNGINWYCPASASDSTTFTQAGMQLFGQNGTYSIIKPNGVVDFFRRVN